MSEKIQLFKIVDSPGGRGPIQAMDDLLEDIRGQLLAEIAIAPKSGHSPNDPLVPKAEVHVFRIQPVKMQVKAYEALPEFEGY